VRLAAGGVAPVPIRLNAAEAAAQGAPVSPATIAAAALAATQGATPLPMTGYKVDLLSGLVQDLLEQYTA
jgi:xanthine dehydrogenase YagS FAD-binding subunit